MIDKAKGTDPRSNGRRFGSLYPDKYESCQWRNDIPVEERVKYRERERDIFIVTMLRYTQNERRS